MNDNQLKLGIFGFGCVGYGLYELLQKAQHLKISIKRVCVKTKEKTRSISQEIFTFDPEDILNDNEINVIVELIDDADFAFYITKTALQKGKAVVSANKKMISEHFEELIDLQQKYNSTLLYEAACCASIPIIRCLEEYYNNDLLMSIEGIMNGSTNYILTKTTEEKISFEEALAIAKKKGYVESNPILDIGGFDPKYKLQILINHAFGIVVPPEEIFNIGIDLISDFEFSYANEKGLKIKLIAKAEKTEEGKVSAYVFPKFINKNDNLFYVDDVFNGIKIGSIFSESQFLIGRGAGAIPTASAVLNDIISISNNYKYKYKKRENKNDCSFISNVLLKVFFRYNPEHEIEVKAFFKEIQESYKNQKIAYLIGVIELDSIKKIIKMKDWNGFFVLVD